MAGEEEAVQENMSNPEGGSEPQDNVEIPDPPEAEAAEDAAPAVDEWKPPSREAYEALQKRADSFRDIEPYADEVRRLIRQGFSPQQAQAAVAPAAAKAPEKDEDEDDTFINLEKYAKLWDEFGSNPRSFTGTIAKIAKRAMKAEFDRVAKLESGYGEIKPAVERLIGFSTLANKRFMKDEKFASIEKEAIDLVNSGKIADFDTAVEHVQAKRDAKAAVMNAAKAAAGGAVAKPKPGVAAAVKAQPKNNPSLNPTVAPKGKGRISDEFVREGNESTFKAAFRGAKKDLGMA